MKRKRCEITDRNEIDAILTRARIGRMATAGADGYPYITPVNYVYHRGSIYFHCSRVGEKLDNIRRDGRVCFEVDIPLAYLDLDYYGENPDGCGVSQFYQCVVLRGRAEIVEGIEEKVDALNALVISHEPEGRKFQRITADTKAVAQCEVVAVRIESVTGKREFAQKKSDEDKLRLASFLRKRNQPGDQEAADWIVRLDRDGKVKA
ncbi:MAG: pyridoxamine 5'-phosphate oxidase family protein [Desulfofustis sp.]|jgi:hypothetical protein|nr:pyridoxamine 5'-phosphate oxidase family protein [Desulfofustis sp.]